jgi:ribosomal-protein-alanine N-acetyltransferase
MNRGTPLAEDHRNKEGQDVGIEPATWHDYTSLHRLERTCFRSEDIWPFWDLIGVLTLPGLVRLKAVAAEEMVGFIAGERELARQRGWITTLAVLPAHRRRGIARALLGAAEETLEMPTIRLSVRASNQAAIALYHNAGYRAVDRWRGYYAGGEDGLVFEKNR